MFRSLVKLQEKRFSQKMGFYIVIQRQRMSNFKKYCYIQHKVRKQLNQFSHQYMTLSKTESPSFVRCNNNQLKRK